MLKVLFIFLLALMLDRPTTLIEHDAKATVVVLDPAYYDATVYHGHTSAGIAFNANYYDPRTRRPIGVLMAHGKYLPYSWDPTVNHRPCLWISRGGKAHISLRPWDTQRNEMVTVVQGGPTLVGIPDKHENMASDTTRVTDQISVGTNPQGKLFVAYTHRMSVAHIATLFRRLGCDHAMKLDGGHSAHLQYYGVHAGNSSVVCGVAFTQK